MGSLILFVVVMGIVLLVATLLHRRARLYSAFDDLGQRYLGRVFTTLAGCPAATFNYRDSMVRVVAKRRLPRNGGRQTCLTMDWPDRRFQLLIFRRGSSFGGTARTGLNPFRSDQPGLHEQYEIWTDDSSLCKTLLSPACVWHLFQLSELSANRHVYWCIRRGKCQINIGGHFRRKELLREAVAKMLELFSQAQLTQQQGLDFVADRSASVIEEMVCPICSGTIGRDVVICSRCRAPHCRECWQYNGKCATFGCGAEKFIAPLVDGAVPNGGVRGRVGG